ncbi:ribokinase [Oceanibacterium hippocampi]|uniref:Ribokinase n=1 Tax=Oceanibacterium hippocampi TaxID=745714 RepID=A0A1Y5T7H4_9PROT|nr:ribokinase [Oceanibacterium hippocampi]SLN55741.1 Ribokinase [Oceanibacterium hippocampi]
MSRVKIAVQGIFVADLAFRSHRMPAPGESVIGRSYGIGPGGKASNQAVAAARAGAEVALIARLGRDSFAEMARALFVREGVIDAHVGSDDEAPTGAAAITVDETTGENAIVVVPGASGRLSTGDIDAAAARIAASDIFMTQLETPPEISAYGLRLARTQGVRTIFNPAPAAEIAADLYALADFFTPNESEAAALAGHPVGSLAEAEAAAASFLSRGVGTAIITLGARGAVVRGPGFNGHVPPFDIGRAVDTTGAGDAYNGALAVAIAEGMPLERALRFAAAAGAVAVTTVGTAEAMPRRDAVERLLAGG